MSRMKPAMTLEHFLREELGAWPRLRRRKHKPALQLQRPAPRQPQRPPARPAPQRPPAPRVQPPLEDLEPYDSEPFEPEWFEEEDLAGDPWGPHVKLGAALRLQAARGVRAAAVELRPGLYLVAEVPAPAARAEFGVIPLLAPLMITAARHALKRPAEERDPAALPEPPAEIGWADRSVVAEVVGCDGCPSCGRGRR